GADGAALVDLHLVDGEVLAQHRQVAGRARGAQVVDGAAEPRPVGEHREARRPTGRVRLGRERGIEVGREVALRRRPALDLGDHAQRARGRPERTGEVARRGGVEGAGPKQIAHLGTVQHRDLVALGREDLVEHRHGPQWYGFTSRSQSPHTFAPRDVRPWPPWNAAPSWWSTTSPTSPTSSTSTWRATASGC